MLRQFLKILSIILIVWGITFFMILKEYKTSKMLHKGYTNIGFSYGKALHRFVRHTHALKKSMISKDWALNGPSNTHITYDDKLTAIKDPIHPLGRFGKAVNVKDDVNVNIRMQIKKGWHYNAFNQFVSDLISVDRALPDFRQAWCKKKKYSGSLPAVTIVICFYNEAWSTLLRTIHSALYNSPTNLLKEIILVDDFSNMRHLKRTLKAHVRKLAKVRLVVAKRREGLIRSRIIGLKEASTNIVVFLDSHCECTKGWLEPLVERVVEDNKTVVSPIIDYIDPSNFEYIAQKPKDIQIGGFNWNLNFIWISIPRHIAAKRINLAAPVKTPTMAGGLFAINKDFFRHLGYYDEKFEIWGGENLELSFKVWMCGGSLEIVPCSHVGHVYRRTFPYEGALDNFKRNSVRLAEVWLDDYANYFYDRIAHLKGDFGDVSKQQELRKNLKCNSFEWYLNNVFPEMIVPNDTAAKGQIYVTGNYCICLDSDTAPPDGIGPVAVRPCHLEGGHQFWLYTKDGRIQFLHLCLDFLFNMLTLFTCREQSVTQIWLYDNEGYKKSRAIPHRTFSQYTRRTFHYNSEASSGDVEFIIQNCSEIHVECTGLYAVFLSKTKHIQHMHTQKCLNVANAEQKNQRAVLERCKEINSQKWTMDNFNVSYLIPKLQIYSKKLSLRNKDFVH